MTADAELAGRGLPPANGEVPMVAKRPTGSPPANEDVRAPADWTFGEAIEHRDAELTARAGVTLTKGSLYTIRSAMRRIRCCEHDGGVSVAHLGVSTYQPEDILGWFDHMVERHGKRYAWAAITTLRDTLEFVRRRGVEVAELDFIKRPADLPKPPSHQRGSRRQKKPLPRLSSLPRLSIHSTLRVAVQHLLVESQKRFDHDDLKEHTLYCYHYFAKKLEEPCGYNEDGTPGPLMADLTLEELHEDHVHDWFYVLEDKISKSTAFGMLKRLRFLLNWVGKRRVRIDYDPTEVMRRRVREKGCGYPRKAPQPFARHELPALRHAVNLLFQQRLREGRRRKYRGRKLAHFIGPIAALRVTLFIGARIGETARMSVRDMRGDAVFLPDTKTGAKRWLYLDREAGLVAALLARLVVRARCSCSEDATSTPSSCVCAGGSAGRASWRGSPSGAPMTFATPTSTPASRSACRSRSSCSVLAIPARGPR